MNDTALGRRRRRRRVADDKRKRAPRACDRCKARKSKCIETTPGRCQRCSLKELSCRFEREMSPEEAHGDDGQSAVSSGSAIQVASATPSHGADDNISIDSHQADRIMWPRFLSRLREAFSLDFQTAPEAQDMMAMQAHISGPRSLQPAELYRLRRAINAFPPRPVADFLLSVCIRHGVDIFFYFDQAQLLADIDEIYNNPESALRTDCGFVALALAAFALGSQWTPFEKPDRSTAGIASAIEDRDPGLIFHRELRALVPDLVELSCLRAIQVFFLMGVYLMPSSPVGSSYVYLGLALRKALAFDLHQNTEDSVVDEREREIRRRLWWSLYSLERITAIKLNRSRTIDVDIVSVSFPSPLPELDQCQLFDNVQHQIAFARLVTILDRVADSGGSMEEKTKTGAIGDVEADLKAWKRALPADFRLANIHPKSSNYRAVFHTYLNYYYSWIAMGKVSVVAVVRTHLRRHIGRQPLPPQVEPGVRDLAFSCIKAASKILRLFEDLLNTGNITRFSFTDFQGCSIATIVTLLAGILERDAGYEARVKFGMDCLRTMAAGNMTNMTAKVGVRFVEALQSIADEAVAKLRRSETVQRRTNRQSGQDYSTASSDYTRWAQWLARADPGPQSSPVSPSGVLSHAETVDLMPHDADAESLHHISASSGDAAGVTGPDSWASTDEHVLRSTSMSAATPAHQHTGAVFPDYMHHAEEPAMPSMLYSDDQSFLMGLTGLDVLDFSELTTPL